jgi:uncharacterized protein YjbI with pentapeptide repeats
MRIEIQKRRLDVHDADLSGSNFDDVNLSGSQFRNTDISGSSFEDLDMSGWRVRNVNLAGASFVDARFEGATIDGVAVTDLLAYWQAGHGAKSA